MLSRNATQLISLGIKRRDIMELLTVTDSIQLSVITSVIEGRLSVEDACDRLGIHKSTFYRKVLRIEQEGPSGLTHKLRGRPSNNSPHLSIKNAVCTLFEKSYKPFGFRTAHFYQDAVHRFPKPVGYSTVVRWLKAKQLISKRHKGWRHHARRPRREAFGELIQMDTSIYDWLDWGTNIALVSAMDDATNVICGAFLTQSDTTLANMTVIKQILVTYGLFAALYVDKSPIFKVTRTGGFGRIIQPTFNADYITQVQRALNDLNIKLIYAHSPQAKGRIERSFSTWQNRLIPELRKHRIKHIDSANNYIRRVFVPNHNKRFAQDPASVPNLFAPLKGSLDLNFILAEKYQLTVSNDHIVSSQRANLTLKILPSIYRRCYAKAKVDVFKHTDGTISVLYKNQPLQFKRLE